MSRSPTRKGQGSPVNREDPDSTENDEQPALGGKHGLLQEIQLSPKPKTRRLRVKGKRKGSSMQSGRGSKRHVSMGRAVKEDFIEEDSAKV